MLKLQHYVFSLSLFLSISTAITGPTATAGGNPNGDSGSSGEISQEISRDLSRVEKVLGITTQLQEISQWRDLSDQYVMGIGADGRPIAIYDKSFPVPFYPHFWRTWILATIGISDINLANLRKHFEKNPEGDVDFEAESHKDHSKFTVDGSIVSDPSLIWKDGKRPVSNRPEKLYLKDLDWKAMESRSLKLKSLLASYRTAYEYLEKHEELPLEMTRHEKLLDMVFELQPDGTYQFHDNDQGMLRPVKVIDLQHPDSSYSRAASWAGLTIILKTALMESPIYGTGNAIAAVLERVFDFLELLYLTRHGQALELVLEAKNGSTNSPFRTLSADELNAAGRYLIRSQTMISSLIYNKYKDLQLGEEGKSQLLSDWAEGVDQVKERSIEYLSQRPGHFTVLPNSYYALRYNVNEDSGKLEKLKIYLLARSEWMNLGKHPIVGVDFLHPNQGMNQRRVLQAILFTSNFIWTPFPMVASVIKLLYKEVFIRNLHRTQLWESGLLAHIHNNPGEISSILMDRVNFTQDKAKAYEDLAVHILERRRMNPLDLDNILTPAYQRKVEAWLRNQDSSYHPWSEFNANHESVYQTTDYVVTGSNSNSSVEPKEHHVSRFNGWLEKFGL